MKNISSDRPVFMVSIDTELIWGYALYPESKTAKIILSDESNGRESIDNLLAIFEKYSIPATWAIVGHLFLEQCGQEGCMANKNLAELKGKGYIFDPCTDIDNAPLYYGRDIILKILSNKVKHEIGYHSFSHIPFSKCSREVAEAEIAEGVKLAKSFGITLTSFVFPEGKIGHIDILKKYGFRVYRGLIANRRSSSRNLIVRAVNYAINEVVTNPVEPRWMNGIWELPSSMFFYDSSLPFTLLPRAKRGIERAIRERRIFHVWLHPHNLLIDRGLSDKLEELIAYVASKRYSGELDVFTMGGFASYLSGNV